MGLNWKLKVDSIIFIYFFFLQNIYSRPMIFYGKKPIRINIFYKLLLSGLFKKKYIGIVVFTCRYNLFLINTLLYSFNILNRFPCAELPVMVFGVYISGRFVTYGTRTNIKIVVSTVFGILKIIFCSLWVYFLGRRTE